MKVDLPKADLLISKDVLQHLRNGDIVELSKQFPKYKHCLITNDVDPSSNTSSNMDIAHIGEYRTLDLTHYPFNMAGTHIFNYKSPYEINGQSWYVVKQTLYMCHNEP